MSPLQAVREWLNDADARGVYWYVTGLVVAFVLIVAAGVVFGRVRVVEAPDAPPKHVSHFPPAQFMRRMDANMCRFTVFDNDAGEAIEDRIARCDEIPPSNTRGLWAKFSWGH